MSSFSSTLAAHDLKLLALLDKGTEDEAIKFYLEIVSLNVFIAYDTSSNR